LKTEAIGRYLVDYENPDAGIGHSLGHVNNAVKVCLRNQLQFAYSDKQLIKSTQNSFKWRMRQWTRRIVGRKPHETHGIGDAICRMFAFSECTASREAVEELIRKKVVRVVALPAPEIAIPSNKQDDELAYAAIDAVIQQHPQDGIVFVLPSKRTGDFEYGSTRDWFKRCYRAEHVLQISETPKSANRTSLRVALHIRRGDLLPGRQFADLAHRMLPDSWYLQVLEALSKASARHMHVVVLSEGLNGSYRSELGTDFSWTQALRHLDCEVIEKIDQDFIESFHAMVQADVLIGSKSGMTHLAGLMGEGIKLVPRMWHSYRGTGQVIELEDTITGDELATVLAQLWATPAT
jgi:hypothetical protein